MTPETSSAQQRGSTYRAVRHHLTIVVVCLLLGALAGWLYSASLPATYTSSTRLLVNPSAGNPFAPTPSSVRQDQQTSLETEAQVARSTEVLGVVSAQVPALTTARLERGLRVNVPANTQVLELSYTAADPVVAQQVVDAVAEAYLANRQRRFEEVNAARIERLENQTLRVVEDLRAATAASQVGNSAKRSFNAQLAGALRNELVSLRAQRTALENLESPAGSVISPASTAQRIGAVTTLAMPVAGGLGGLGLGLALAMLLERLTGKVRSAADVEKNGVPVLAASPTPGVRRLLGWRGADLDTTIRRLRSRVLDLEPRPEVITIAPLGSGRSDAEISEAVAEGMAKAGLRVVLVRTEPRPSDGHLAVADDGLAEALLHERLSVLDLLRPSLEPLLSILNAGGSVAQSRDLLSADRLRSVLDPLVEAGHLVVVQAPGVDSVEGEAMVGAADLGLVVVRLDATRPHLVTSLADRTWKRGTATAAVVVSNHRRFHRSTGSRFDEVRRHPVLLPSGHDLGEQPLSAPPSDVAR